MAIRFRQVPISARTQGKSIAYSHPFNQRTHTPLESADDQASSYCASIGCECCHATRRLTGERYPQPLLAETTVTAYNGFVACRSLLLRWPLVIPGSKTMGISDRI